MWQASASADPPVGDDLVDDGLTVRLLAAGDDGVRAGGGQQLGDFSADTAAGAGDEGHFAGKVEQVGWMHERVPCDKPEGWKAINGG